MAILFSNGPIEYIVVGLGNPGKKYEWTRHNSGFIALDCLAQRCSTRVTRLKWNALVGEAVIAGKRVLLMKPQTFMNASGEAVSAAMNFYKLPPERVVVLLDDISLSPGKLRIRRKGSDGGQRGMRSIITCTGSDNFPRVKLGIGAKPHPEYELADWVLSTFSPDEKKLMTEAADRAADAVELIIKGELDKAMNLYN